MRTRRRRPRLPALVAVALTCRSSAAVLVAWCVLASPACVAPARLHTPHFANPRSPQNFADMMAGAGGAGGMPDMSALMGGAGGAGGMPDMSALMGGAGMPDMSALGGEGEGDSDDDEGAIPGLEGDAVPGSESSASGAQATGGN